MKKYIFLGSLALFILLTAGFLASSHTGSAIAAEGKKVTLTGEVLDLYCYMDHAAKGEEHAKCATACINKGIPAGFLSEGTVYLLLGGDHNSANEKVAEFAGKPSKLTGTLVEQNGVKAIKVESIKGA